MDDAQEISTVKVSSGVDITRVSSSRFRDELRESRKKIDRMFTYNKNISLNAKILLSFYQQRLTIVDYRML